MPSSFTWLDHTDGDRRRVLEAVERFKETGTRDELGLGTIRDAFADLLFPGTSTIQTRARYFLFIPWMYAQLHQKRVSADKVVDRARKEEVRLRDSLLQSEDDDGVIGKVAGAALKRLPSNTYWNGLAVWRIRQFGGSQEDYHRFFDRFPLPGEGGTDDDGESLEAGARPAWHPHLPPVPDDFPNNASFALTPDEAVYLSERICCAAPRSLLAFLVRRAQSLEAPFAWAHPQFAEFPESVQQLLEHGRLLSEAMHGAAILYNLMLSEQLPEGERRTSLVEWFRARLDEWVNELEPRQPALQSWDLKAFWLIVQQRTAVSPTTRQFVERWLALAPWRSPSMVADNVAARALIRDRERRLKGPRARLGNTRALELWNGASGIARLSYRWPSAVSILTDIHAALPGRKGASHAVA